MNALSLIWLSSLALAGISPLVMLFLVVRRAALTRRQRRNEIRKNELAGEILSFLDGTQSPETLRATLRPGDDALLGKTVSDFIRVVRGEDRRRLTELLAQLGALDLLMKTARKGKIGERIQAIVNLGYFNDPRIPPLLRSLLDHPSYGVRLAAARTLVELKAVDSVDVLIDKLGVATGKRSRALLNLFRRLGSQHTPQILDILRRQGDDATGEAIIVLCAEALGRIGDAKVIPALVDIAHAPSVDVRAAAFRALFNLALPETLPLILSGLKDEAWAVRAQAAICAGRLSMGEAVAPLGALLDDEKWWVRYRAAQALFSLGEAGQKALREAMVTSTARGAEMARSIFGEKGIIL